ncbi:hypothetical protein C900_05277 [Fulvivirga imtechensis AK7]|uniref:Uncharacterized protein n=1 Tax=Fulvivirga imtechensis AK7 TaxID=1237149 RepID=L8JJX4_9BACT|nr:hypothetical protein [Fulvivirga imtechensis]ELR69206.1 hypothetical protein C900_05277 [Fulvivirga imtechensis AK7]
MKCQKAERTEVREHFWDEHNADIEVETQLENTCIHSSNIQVWK